MCKKDSTTVHEVPGRSRVWEVQHNHWLNICTGFSRLRELTAPDPDASLLCGLCGFVYHGNAESHASKVVVRLHVVLNRHGLAGAADVSVKGCACPIVSTRPGRKSHEPA